MRAFLQLAAAAAVVASAVGAPAAGATDARACAVAESTESFSTDDRMLGKKLEEEGRKLFAAGRLGTNFLRQLSLSTCSVAPLAARSQALSPAEVYRAALASVVVVGELFHCGKCDQIHVSPASGFMISPAGALVTCRHVVERTNTLGLAAMTRDGKVWPVKGVLATSRPADVAVLQLDGSGFPALPLSTNAPVGTPISVISHPDGHYFMFTAGMVSRYYQLGRRNRPTDWMTITAPFAKGSSGAPVLDAAGNVVGIVNNTESIYYDQAGRSQRDLQMVIHNCTPAAELLKLLSTGLAKSTATQTAR